MVLEFGGQKSEYFSLKTPICFTPGTAPITGIASHIIVPLDVRRACAFETFPASSMVK